MRAGFQGSEARFASSERSRARLGEGLEVCSARCGDAERETESRKAREKQRAEVVVALSNLRSEFAFASGFAIFEVWKVPFSFEKFPL